MNDFEKLTTKLALHLDKKDNNGKILPNKWLQGTDNIVWHLIYRALFSLYFAYKLHMWGTIFGSLQRERLSAFRNYITPWSEWQPHLEPCFEPNQCLHHFLANREENVLNTTQFIKTDDFLGSSFGKFQINTHSCSSKNIYDPLSTTKAWAGFQVFNAHCFRNFHSKVSHFNHIPTCECECWFLCKKLPKTFSNPNKFLINKRVNL